MRWFDRVAQPSSSRLARRWLPSAVAVEMVVAGLALISIAGVTPMSGATSGRSASFESSPTAAVAGEWRAAPGTPGAAAGTGGHMGNLSGSKAGGVGGASEVSRATPNEHADGAVEGISFKPPIDFATGAVPSSAAFNVAHGDQMPLPATRATPMSDSVAVGDFNHDGNSDVAQTNVIAGTVSIFLGNGRSGFAPPQQHPVGVNPVFVVAGDLDLDGELDLAVADSGSNDVAILRGNGDGSFRPASFVPVPNPRNVAVGDFNGDDIPDLAVASGARAAGAIPPMGGVAILTGNEEGGFSLAQFITLTANGRPVGANYVAAGDFNSSGFDDLAVGVGNSPSAGDQQATDTKLTGDDVLIFLNRDRPLGATPAQPFTTPTEQQRIRVGGLPNAIVVADSNGDTHPDLAVLGGFSGDITTLLGDSQGHFVVKATNTTVGSLPFALAGGHFDDDGVLDLVTANWTSSTVSVLQGHGDGTFRPAVDFWSGDATTGAAAGDFNGDGRLDIVAGRLRNDHLALLLNDSPQPGDGVMITRDISYGSPTHPTGDPFAAHHTLDVYSPPPGTVSFAGRGRPYPVVLWAHGGGWMTGDKTMPSYVMRSLAIEGIVAVSTDYRLGLAPQGVTFDDQAKDLAQAFRWVRDNVGSSKFRGDPRNIFVAGTSAGASLMAKLATEGAYEAEQRNISGLVMLGGLGTNAPNATKLPPSLLMNGNQAYEVALTPGSTAFSAQLKLRGAQSDTVIIPGRDHMTLVSDLALAEDLGRVAVIDFLRSHLAKP